MNESLTESARDFIRAAAGGLVIGLPLLYTMEVWWHGFILPPWKVLLLLGVAYLIVIAFNAISGFRRERTFTELIVDSTAALGLGVVIAFVALLVLGQIDGSTSLRDAAGKVGLEAIPIAFGASLAATELGGDESGGRSGTGPFERVLVGAGGALLFALNLAPTEELVMLGIVASPGLLIVVVGATLLLTLALVFYADFGGRKRVKGDGPLEHPWSETLAAYAVSLGVALLLLWAFGRTDDASGQSVAGMTVMLAVMASVGAAIARLLVGGHDEAGQDK